MKDRPTIRDVAAAAGVSYQTVSRVLNSSPDVAETTRQRVQRVIDDLGYQPSAVARSLASKRTRTLGLITQDFSDFFFTQVIVGAEAEARRAGYRLILGSTERNPEDEPEYLRLLTEREVDGILFARPSTESDAYYVRSLLRTGVPIVTTAYSIPGEVLAVVDVDNVEGGRQAGQCLVGSGRTPIHVIAGPAGWNSVRDRAAGFRQALQEAGISPEQSFVERGDWSYKSGYEAMSRLLTRDESVSALFAHNDRMAIGAMRALRETGRTIPGDVCIVGYDDIPPAAYAHPPLTTVHQPMQEVGRLAASLLIEMVGDPQVERQQRLLQPHLIERGTCGCACTGDRPPAATAA